MGTASNYLPVASFNKSVYVGKTVAPYASTLQVCSLFLPDQGRFAKPRGGWPLLVCMNLSGFQNTYIQTNIGTQVDYINATTPDTDSSYETQMLKLRFLESGYAVLDCALTVAYGGPGGPADPTYGNGTTLGQTGSTDIDYTVAPKTYAYGNAPVGNGCFVPYIDGSLPSNYSGTVHPLLMASRNTAYRDSSMICQWVANNATAMGIDPANIVGFGSSAGADCIAFNAYGPNHASEFFPNGTGQETRDTRIFKATVLEFWQPWFRVLSNTNDAAPLDATGGILMFPRVPSNGADSAYLAYDVPTNGMEFTNSTHVSASSAYTLATTGGGNTNAYCYTYFADTNVVGTTYDSTQTAKTKNPHDSWNGSLWRTLMGSNCRFVMTKTQVTDAMATPPTYAPISDATVIVATAGHASLHGNVLARLVSAGGLPLPMPTSRRFPTP